MSHERLRIKDISAKSILVKSSLPDTDLVVNPYIGCQFACAYCYASFMGAYYHEEDQAIPLKEITEYH